MSSHVVTYVSGLYMGKGFGERIEKNRAATKLILRPVFIPLDGGSIYAA